MRSIRLKIIGTFVGISILALTLMRFFHGYFIVYNKNYLTQGLASFLPIVGTIMIVAAIIIAIKGKPLDNIVYEIQKGHIITPEEAGVCSKIINSVPVIILWVNGLGFFVGPLVSIIVKLKGAPLVSPINIVTILYNIGLGLVCALFEIKLIDNYFVSIRELFRVHYLPKGLKLRNNSKRTVLTAGVSIYLVAILLLAGFVGYFTNGINSVEPLIFLNRIVLVILFVIAVLLVIIYTFTYYTTTMAKLITKKISAMSSGEGDLSSRMNIVNNDEYGLLIHSINSYMDSLKDLLIKIHDTHGKVSSASSDLYDLSKTIEEYISDIGNKSKGVEESSRGQMDLVTNTDKTIRHMIDVIENVATKIKEQSNFVSTSSVAIEEMVSNIGSVSNIAQRANSQSSELRDVSNKGRESVTKTAHAFREVEASSQEMKSIVALISKVAAQTNLLAMNAAIEAAHAGEAGMGFAVVASEVRKLAEDSGNSIKKIIDLIKEMNEKINKGVSLSKEAEVAFDKISSDISITTELIETISSAMEEQQQGADEVLNSITSLVEATRKIENLSQEQKSDSKNVERSMSDVKEHSITITNSVSDQNSSLLDIKNKADKIVELAKVNSLAVEDLEDSISKFSL